MKKQSIFILFVVIGLIAILFLYVKGKSEKQSTTTSQTNTQNSLVAGLLEGFELQIF